MTHLNIEIKARSEHPERIRQVLFEHKASFKGLDHQIDTYFNVANGRLKLRQGCIESQLIHYDRPDQAGPKPSLVTLYQPGDDPAVKELKEVLTRALGVLVVVDKQREIYFIENVKFHVDTVERLGSFVEIEAIDTSGEIGRDALLQQCQDYMALFEIQAQDLIEYSYSDLLLHRKCRGEASLEANTPTGYVS